MRTPFTPKLNVVIVSLVRLTILSVFFIRSIALKLVIRINIELGVARGVMLRLLHVSVYFANTGIPNYSSRPLLMLFVCCGLVKAFACLVSVLRSCDQHVQSIRGMKQPR